jgi:hypothetical protein
MEDKKHAHNDAHFQKELDSLEINMASITSLLNQMLKKNLRWRPSQLARDFF